MAITKARISALRVQQGIHLTFVVAFVILIIYIVQLSGHSQVRASETGMMYV